MLSILVKHLEHKNVAKEPRTQADIVRVTTQLAQNAKPQASVAMVGSIAELIKHLRKCLQKSAELSGDGPDVDKSNSDLQYVLEKCISLLSQKVYAVLYLSNFSGVT